MSALIEAARWGNTKVVILLAESGANLDLQSCVGQHYPTYLYTCAYTCD